MHKLVCFHSGSPSAHRPAALKRPNSMRKCLYESCRTVESWGNLTVMFWVRLRASPKAVCALGTHLRPALCDLTWFLRPWDFPDKNTGVGCRFLLQGIFLTQGWNLGLPHCRQTLYCLSDQEILEQWRRVAVW